MSVLAIERGQTVDVRLRGLDVEVEVEVDAGELAARERQGLSLDGLDHAHLGALLALPRWETAQLADLPAAAQTFVRRHPELVERSGDGLVRRRVGPPLWVELVTLPTPRWQDGLKLVGRFAPYSARRLSLSAEPEDVGDLCVQATYWGVGVRIADGGEVRDLVQPESFVPHRYTGASWAFAEQALAALRGSVGTPVRR